MESNENSYRDPQTVPSIESSSSNLDCSVKTQNNILPIQSHVQSNIEAINLLLERTKYPLVQENGQRKYGPPPDWGNKTIPDRGCEAFIGKIPRDCFEDEIIPILERIGPIYEFRLMMEYSGYNRGYGFVMYTSREHSRKCVNELNNFEIRKGRMIGVCRSVDNCRLFVGGIPKNKKKEEILEEMRKVTDDVINVIVYPSAHDKTKNRGFAFVQYSSHRAAAIARRKLIPNRIQLFGQPIAVDWAEPEPEVDDDIMATVKVVYVRNLMIDTTEETIKTIFEKATKEGSIERVKKMKDFAFVHFKEREDAINCIDKLNGQTIDGSMIELSLSKPADKANLQKLLRANTSPTNGLDFYFNPNIIPNTPILTFPLISDPSQCPIVSSESLITDNQNIQPITLPAQADLNQKAFNYINSPYLNYTKIPNKTKTYPKASLGYNKALYLNQNKFNHYANLQNGVVIGTVKKQATNQDVPYELVTNFSHIPVLAYPNQNIQYQNKSPIQYLDEICKKEGLNTPIYSLHTTSGTDQDGKEIGLYMYKISISNFLNGQSLCSNRLMRTIEEAKQDAADFVISQFYANTNQTQNYVDYNEQYLGQIQAQNNHIMQNTIIPTNPFIIPTDIQNPHSEISTQNYNSDNSINIQTNTSQSTSNESLNSSLSSSVTSSQVLVSSSCQLPSQVTQYILDSTGQYVLYPTQAFY